MVLKLFFASSINPSHYLSECDILQLFAIQHLVIGFDILQIVSLMIHKFDKLKSVS